MDTQRMYAYSRVIEQKVYFEIIRNIISTGVFTFKTNDTGYKPQLIDNLFIIG